MNQSTDGHGNADDQSLFWDVEQPEALESVLKLYEELPLDEISPDSFTEAAIQTVATIVHDLLGDRPDLEADEDVYDAVASALMLGFRLSERGAKIQ